MTLTREDQAAADAALSDQDFRMVVRHWIAENYDLERNLRIRPPFAYTRNWYRRLNERGWLAPGWPAEHGGGGLSMMKQIIIIEEQEQFGTCRLNDMGVTMVGPLLIRFGTDEQRATLLPGILTGDTVWCQGYSEPGSGSDLASLRSEAVLDGDHWVINGQKLWTTRGNDANWMFGLFRTEKTGRKHDGISMFVFPMETPGIVVKPITDLNGGTELCATFFDNVRIPASALVGEVNKGWWVSTQLLGLERLYVGLPKQSAHALARLHDLITLTGQWEDGAVLDAYTQLHLDLDDHISLYQAMIDEIVQTNAFPPNISILKISQSELYQRITTLMMKLGGEMAGLLDPLVDEDNLFPANQFLLARPATIYGGSSEIQRNILAQRVLGLPK